jgi:hypothetical protein
MKNCHFHEKTYTIIIIIIIDNNHHKNNNVSIVVVVSSPFGNYWSSSPYLVSQILVCTFLCSGLAFQLKAILLLDTHHLLMLSSGTLMYLKQISFSQSYFMITMVLFNLLDINYAQYIFFSFLTS